MKYNMGDKVFVPSNHTTEKHILCPDCGGTKTLRVTLFDGTSYDIACATCASGYEPPKGYVVDWYRLPIVFEGVIVGVRVSDPDGVEYSVRNGPGYTYIYSENEVFDNFAAAEACAKIKCKEAEEAAEARVLNKEKPHRSWAWHVTYHRRCAKDAAKNLEYHTRKLNIAKEKKKATEE